MYKECFYTWLTMSMHKPINGHNPCNIMILHVTIDYNKNFTTMWLLTIKHMALFVVKSLHMQIIEHFMFFSMGFRGAT